MGVADSEFGGDRVLGDSCRWHNLWSVLQSGGPPVFSDDQRAEVWFSAWDPPRKKKEKKKKTHPLGNTRTQSLRGGKKNPIFSL